MHHVLGIPLAIIGALLVLWLLLMVAWHVYDRLRR